MVEEETERSLQKMRIRGSSSPFLPGSDDPARAYEQGAYEQEEIKVVSVTLLVPEEEIRMRGDLQVAEKYKHLIINPFTFDELSSNTNQSSIGSEYENPENINRTVANEDECRGDDVEKEIMSYESTNQMNYNFSSGAVARKSATASSSSLVKNTLKRVYRDEETNPNKRIKMRSLSSIYDESRLCNATEFDLEKDDADMVISDMDKK